MNKKEESKSEVEVVPEEFKKVLTDFINDFTITFPEYSEKLKDNFVVVSVKNDGNVVAEEVLDESRCWQWPRQQHSISDWPREGRTRRK